MIPIISSVNAAAEFSRAAVAAGIAASVQVTLLVAAGCLFARAIKRLGPAAQSLVYRLTLIGICLVLLLDGAGVEPVPAFWRLSLPTATRGLSKSRAQMAPSGIATGPWHYDRMPSAAGAEPSIPGMATAPFGSSSYAPASSRRFEIGATSAEQEHAIPTPDTTERAYIASFAIYTLGMVAALAWFLASVIGLRRILAHGIPSAGGPTERILAEICDGLGQQSPPLRLHRTAPTPFVTGIRRPTIVVPMILDRDAESAALRAILSHELAHLQRRDPAWRLLVRFVTIVLWFHPLVWQLRCWMDEADETTCDLAAVDLGCPPVAYAGFLIKLAEMYPAGRMPRSTEARIAGFRSALGRRVERILRSSERRRPLNRPTRTAVCFSAGLTIVATLAMVSSARPAEGTRPRFVENSSPPALFTAQSGASNQLDSLQRRFVLRQVGPSTPLSSASPTDPSKMSGHIAPRGLRRRGNNRGRTAREQELRMKMQTYAPALIAALFGTTMNGAAAPQQPIGPTHTASTPSRAAEPDVSRGPQSDSHPARGAIRAATSGSASKSAESSRSSVRRRAPLSPPQSTAPVHRYSRGRGARYRIPPATPDALPTSVRVARLSMPTTESPVNAAPIAGGPLRASFTSAGGLSRGRGAQSTTIAAAGLSRGRAAQATTIAAAGRSRGRGAQATPIAAAGRSRGRAAQSTTIAAAGRSRGRAAQAAPIAATGLSGGHANQSAKSSTEDPEADENAPTKTAPSGN